MATPEGSRPTGIPPVRYPAVAATVTRRNLEQTAATHGTAAITPINPPQARQINASCVTPMRPARAGRVPQSLNRHCTGTERTTWSPGLPLLVSAATDGWDA